jgi:hypothetical protein
MERLLAAPFHHYVTSVPLSQAAVIKPIVGNRDAAVCKCGASIAATGDVQHARFRRYLGILSTV